MNVGEQISLFDQNGWFSKMSAECSVPTTEKISEPSSKKRQELPTPTSQFLDLRTDWVGAMLGSFWQTDGLWLGRYTLRSIGGFPKEERESRLSQILEVNPHPKYCLSGKACQGILNRAERRGKELPPILKEALEQSVSKSGRDVKGGGKGILIQNERSAPLKTLNNQAVCSLHRGGQVNEAMNPDVELSKTLNCTHEPMKVVTTTEARVFGISPFASNAMKSSNPDSGIYEADTARTLDLNGGSPACNQGGMVVVDPKPGCFSQDAYDKYTPTETSASLKSSGGNYGGGTETIVTSSELYKQETSKE